MISDAWWERNRTWATFLLIALMIGLFFTGRFAATGYVEMFRLVSDGAPTVMAIAGWLLYIAPFGLLWAVVVMAERASAKTPATLCLALLLLLAPIDLSLFPGGVNSWLGETVSGPGGGAFVTGMRNGCLAGVVASVTIPFVLFNETLRNHFGGRTLAYMLIAPIGTFVAATLVAAITLA
ncbi:hypothetical protein [Actinoplanes subglobosus]|uniref:Uncharacterized protein n=1 Tax=Actinoplanes subglobosus TaxID=1547892 RepID=A0ABV8INN2_9ACTN